MPRTKRTLKALAVILMGMWALSATEAQASMEGMCDADYCLPGETICTVSGTETWCNNACSEWTTATCTVSDPRCEGGIVVRCNTGPN